MPLYFAYGANMDTTAMAARCPRSRPLGRARLVRHRFVVLETGYASVARDARAEVHGLLWDLALADAPALDRFEDVARGLYRKLALPVMRERTPGAVHALVYVGAAQREGAPAPGYMENVAAAARALALPASYVACLDSLIPVRAQGRAAP
jgi:gamma-glutamylcyclotransferase (GGCT)/AIG2-like uncharacterized protein YtfP